MSLVATDRDSLTKELEKDADCHDQTFRRIQTEEGPPRKQEPGRAFDPPVHPRSGRLEQNNGEIRLHLDKSMPEASRRVRSLGSGVERGWVVLNGVKPAARKAALTDEG